MRCSAQGSAIRQRQARSSGRLLLTSAASGRAGGKQKAPSPLAGEGWGEGECLRTAHRRSQLLLQATPFAFLCGPSAPLRLCGSAVGRRQ